MRTFRYRTAVVVYSDFLAFRELIDKSTRNPKIIKDIFKALELIKERTADRDYSYSDHGPVFASKFRSFNFSDLTVRVTLIEDNLVDVLNWEIGHLSDIQALLTCSHGVLLRGAVSIGQISIEPQESEDDPEEIEALRTDNVIFGPALVRSYELESRAAKYPRIIVDKDIISKASPAKDALWADHLAQDDDGQYFIDYLNNCAYCWLIKEYRNYQPREVRMENHKKVVEAKLKEYKTNPSDAGIGEKLKWLAKYHNSTVEQMRTSDLNEDGRDPSPLLIAKHLFRF
jgi:hypothetical protein